MRRHTYILCDLCLAFDPFGAHINASSIIGAFLGDVCVHNRWFWVAFLLTYVYIGTIKVEKKIDMSKL